MMGSRAWPRHARCAAEPSRRAALDRIVGASLNEGHGELTGGLPVQALEMHNGLQT